MKKIEKLSLNRLSKKELTNPEMNKVKGGQGCACGCCYLEQGGSSNDDNGTANCHANLNSGTICDDGGAYICG